VTLRSLVSVLTSTIAVSPLRPFTLSRLRTVTVIYCPVFTHSLWSPTRKSFRASAKK
jgi:hypothetical protein